MNPEEVAAYVKEHALEDALSRALNDAIAAKTDAPLLDVADSLEAIAAEREAKQQPPRKELIAKR